MGMLQKHTLVNMANKQAIIQKLNYVCCAFSSCPAWTCPALA